MKNFWKSLAKSLRKCFICFWSTGLAIFLSILLLPMLPGFPGSLFSLCPQGMWPSWGSHMCRWHATIWRPLRCKTRCFVWWGRNRWSVFGGLGQKNIHTFVFLFELLLGSENVRFDGFCSAFGQLFFFILKKQVLLVAWIPQPQGNYSNMENPYNLGHSATMSRSLSTVERGSPKADSIRKLVTLIGWVWETKCMVPRAPNTFLRKYVTVSMYNCVTLCNSKTNQNYRNYLLRS